MKLLDTRYKWLIIVCAFALVLFSCGGSTESRDAKKEAERLNKDLLPEEDLKAAEFMVFAADHSLDYIQKIHLAEGRTENENLKRWGQTFLSEEEVLMNRLQQLAVSKKVTLPESPSRRHLRECEVLSGKSKTEFDTAYSRSLTKDLETEIVRFEKEAEKSTIQAVRSFAFESLPVLQGALDELRLFRAGKLNYGSE